MVYMQRRRRATIFSALMMALIIFFVNYYNQPKASIPNAAPHETSEALKGQSAIAALDSLEIKGRAPKTNYSRAQFGDGWMLIGGCDMRNIVLNRDLVDVKIDDKCNVVSGRLSDPYTGKQILFEKGDETSADVQIDHVVALSDAWQKGAQALDIATRIELANDPLELLAVDGPTNQKKSDSDAASWLPPNKGFRCQYVARQIAVKKKYSLWVTAAEYEAIKTVLASCPLQSLPIK